MRGWGKWENRFPPSYFSLFPKSSVFIFFHQQPVFPLMDHESHVNIQLSTKVCHILTKKSLSFSFSSFSFPFLSLKAWMWRCFFRTIQFYFSNRLSFTKISLLKSQAFFFFLDSTIRHHHFTLEISVYYSGPLIALFISLSKTLWDLSQTLFCFSTRLPVILIDW